MTFDINNISDVALDAELCRRNLGYFIESAWDTIEPGVKFSSNWHIDAMNEHLQACEEGRIKRLLINIPPRHMKSLGTSVAFPAWVWSRNPHKKFIYLSYGQELSSRDSSATRRLIQSPFYQERFGDKFQLLPDANRKTNFGNDKLGVRYATSVEGGLTGHGADIIVVDDPHNVQQAESAAEQEKVIDLWTKALQSRLNDQENGVIIVVMQRISDNDLSGYILENEDFFDATLDLTVDQSDRWSHLCFPAKFETKHPTPTKSALGFEDPRTEDRQALWESRFNTKVLDRLEKTMGNYGFVGQYQQRPSPDGGGVIKKTDWKKWNKRDSEGNIILPSRRDVEMVIQSYDTAFEENNQADYSASTTWLVFRDVKGRRNALLYNSWQDRLAFPELKQHMKDEYYDLRPSVMLIEKKASGISIAQELSDAGLPVLRVNPDTSKLARAHTASTVFRNGLVYYLDTPENQATIEQCASFPNGKNDDLVDTVTQSLIYLKNSYMINEDDFIEDDEEEQNGKEENALLEVINSGLYG